MPKKAPQKRWKCPECGKGINAPGKMPAKDVRRFCLPCSEGSRLLVERFCVARETKEAEKKRRAEEAKQRRKEAKNMYPWILHKYHRQWAKLQAWEGKYPALVKLEVKRSPTKEESTAKVRNGDIIFIAGSDQAKAYSILLETMAQIATKTEWVSGTVSRSEFFSLYKTMRYNAVSDLGLPEMKDISAAFEATQKYHVEVAPRMRSMKSTSKARKKKTLSDEEKKKRRFNRKQAKRKTKAEWA